MNGDYFNKEFLINGEIDEEVKKDCDIKNVNSKKKCNLFLSVVCFQTFLCVFLMAILGGLKLISPDMYTVIGQQIKTSLEGEELKSELKNILEKIKLSLSELKPIDLENMANNDEIEAEYDDESEKYHVMCNGDSIGTLPASAIRYAEDHNISPEYLDIIIADVDYDIEKERDIISVYISD